jgi:hypothetical protein
MHGIRCSKCGFFSWASPQLCERCGEPLPEIKRTEPIGTYSKSFREATPVILETYKPPELKSHPKPVAENSSANGSSDSNSQTKNQEQETSTFYTPPAMRTGSSFDFESQKQTLQSEIKEEELTHQPEVEEEKTSQELKDNQHEAEIKEEPDSKQETDDGTDDKEDSTDDEVEKKKQKNLAKYHRKVDYKLLEYKFSQKKSTAIVALVMGAVNLLFAWYLSTQHFSNLVSAILDISYFQIAFCAWIGFGCVVSLVAYRRAKTSNSYGGENTALIGLGLSIIALLLMLFVTAKLIPKLIDSYKEPNEVLAYRSIRKLHDAEKEYKKRTGEFGLMQELSAQGLVDRELAKETKDDYSFVIKAGREICEIFATPLNKSSNEMSFYISLKDGVVHGARKNGEQASADDPVVTDANLGVPSPVVQNKPANTNQNTTPPVVTIPPSTTKNTNQSSLEESINATREIAVIASIRMLYASEITYQASTGSGKFGTMQQLHEAGLIDAQFVAGKKHEYIFSIKLIKDICEIHAIPINPKKTKKSFFLSSLDGVTRFAERNGKPASFKDQPIGK